MRYSTKVKYIKYVKGYGFLSFARIFGDKYGKKLMDTATKTWIEAPKTASKRVVQKNVEVTSDLIWNKITKKITSVGKTKRNLRTTRKKVANYWWLKAVLTPDKNGISKNYKPAKYNIWQCT